jgi:hypothetical protein
MVNTYLNHADYFLQNATYYQKNKESNSLIYSLNQSSDYEIEEHLEAETTESLTANAVQRNWQTPTEFPCTPKEIGEDPLVAYFDNIKERDIFCRNQYSTSIVLKRAFSKDCQSIYVMTEFSKREEAIKPYALAEITYENGLFVHTGCTFFAKEGAEKQFTIAQGLEWTGVDSIDDYC